MSLLLDGDRPATVRLGTIVARNYIAQARVLWESVSLVHPEIETTTLLVDGLEEDRALPGLGRVLLPTDLDLPETSLHSMMAIYDVMEFSTALKPSLLTYLLSEGAQVAAYFDPDIYFYQRIDDLFAHTYRSGVSLTPHAVNPFPTDHHLVTEKMVMWAGIYNLGYIAVSPKAQVVLDWWRDRLLTHAISDPQNALFTDQRWMDWMPALATPHIERGLGYNVAHWNLHEREITVAGSTVLAGGEPLRFLHFSGYDPSKPWLVSKHTAEDPRVLLSESSALKDLCDAYGEKLVASGHPRLRLMAYGLAHLSNGFRLSSEVRRFYRQVLVGELDSPTAPPDPFTRPDQFERWFLLRQFGSRLHPLSGLALAFWNARPDLHALFPRPLEKDGRAYARWFDDDAGATAWVASIVRRRNIGRSRPVHPPAAAPAAVYVVSGDHSGSPGRAHADGLRRSLARSGTTIAIVDASAFEDGEPIEPVDVDWSTIGAGSTVVTCFSGGDAGPGGVRFAVDLSDAPAVTAVAFVTCAPDILNAAAVDEIARADEVWAASRWAADALENLGRFSVRYVPVPLRPNAFSPSGAATVPAIADDDFVFLCIPSPSSSTWRAALEDAVDAFGRVYETNPASRLVVTTGVLPTEAREWLFDAAERRGGIVLADTASTLQSALIVRADCFVALDPASGISSLIADVIASGTPIIATTHPASRELLDYGAAELVPARHTPATSRPANGAWSGADLEHAARAMRSLVGHPSKGERLATRARAGVADRFSLGAATITLPTHSGTTAGTQK
jgi:hypothetical protein